MSSVKVMELRDNFQLQKILNGMGLLNGKTEQSKKLPELCSMKLSDSFWREAVYTVVYILNRGQLRVNKDMTPY